MDNFFRKTGTYLGTAGLLLSAILADCRDHENLTSHSGPNIVLIIADDLGYGELGCQGNTQIPTPNIDAIASKGVRFTSGYVSAPNCSPSRAGILTGKYQTRFGYESNPIGEKNEDPICGLPTDQITIADIMRENGYATALIGKWHLGGAAKYHPMRRGYDEFYGFLHEGHTYVDPSWNGATSMYRRKTLPNGGKGRWIGKNVVYYTAMGYDEPPYDANNPIIRGGQPIEESSYLTEAIAREAVDFIERKKNQPFFLQVAFNAVHSPMQAKNSDLSKFPDIEDIQRRIFAAMLTNMDDAVGQIITKLKETGIEDNTMVIFLSDNGGPTRELTSSNAPLRGEKGNMYEGGIRIPFMIQWTGRIPKGTVYNGPVISLDILPTVAAAVGVNAPQDIDGVDILPYLTGDKKGFPHQYLFWRQKGKTALRKGNWKIVNSKTGALQKEWELYNLEDDIGEKRNLKIQYPEKFIELYDHWNELNEKMDEPLF